MNRRLYFAIGGGVVLLGVIVLFLVAKRPHAIILTGIVTTDDVIVSSQVQGQIAQLLVKEGDTVTAGRLMAVIEPGELQADQSYYGHLEQGSGAQVKQAESELKYQVLQTRDQIHQAEAGLSSAEAQQVEAAADLEHARLEYERTKKLAAEQISSTGDLDQARTSYESLRAHEESTRKQVDAQRAALALAQSTAEQVAVKQSQLVAGRQQLAAAAAQKQRADVRFEYTEIRAPLPAYVATLAARQGEIVSPGQAIVSLINPDDLWVRADVEETYIDQIRIGDRMKIRLPSGAERTGVIFYRAVDAGFATQRDVSRTKRDIKTFEIRLRVDNADRRLWPGLTAYVMLPIETPH